MNYARTIELDLPYAEGKTLVQALDPEVMVRVPEEEGLKPVAEEAGRRIDAALGSLTATAAQP